MLAHVPHSLREHVRAHVRTRVIAHALRCAKAVKLLKHPVELLYGLGVPMERKPFSMGVRLSTDRRG